ncbi:hypothetical protein KR067_005016, partial [Drosophila pandora]
MERRKLFLPNKVGDLNKFGSAFKQFLYQVMQYGDFINQIRKTLYYGAGTVDSEMDVSLPLAEYAAEIFSEPHRGQTLHRLNCVAAGKIQATPCSLIMALIYLDRLNVIDPGYCCRITPQELFVVSLMISTKFYIGHDERFYLEDWAKAGSMSEDRLKQMELDFLSSIDWNIYISKEEFFKKLSYIERALAEREGLRRGWLTYSELVRLLPCFTLTKFFLNSIGVLTLSYAASVITLAGAFFIASQVPGTLWHRKSAVLTMEPSIIAASASTPNATQPGPVIMGEISQSSKSCTDLNIEVNLLKLEEGDIAETRLNEIQSIRLMAQSDPNFSRRINYYDHNCLTFKSQCAGNQNNWLADHRVRLNDCWNQSKNASLFWQFLTNAMK